VQTSVYAGLALSTMMIGLSGPAAAQNPDRWCVTGGSCFESLFFNLASSIPIEPAATTNLHRDRTVQPRKPHNAADHSSLKGRNSGPAPSNPSPTGKSPQDVGRY
jgi:hypothetical protein